MTPGPQKSPKSLHAVHAESRQSAAQLGQEQEEKGRRLWINDEGRIIAEESVKHMMYLIHGGFREFTEDDLTKTSKSGS